MHVHAPRGPNFAGLGVQMASEWGHMCTHPSRLDDLASVADLRCCIPKNNLMATRALPGRWWLRHQPTPKISSPRSTPPTSNPDGSRSHRQPTKPAPHCQHGSHHPGPCLERMGALSPDKARRNRPGTPSCPTIKQREHAHASPYLLLRVTPPSSPCSGSCSWAGR